MGLLAPVAQLPPPAHARLPGEVASGEHVGKACVTQQCLHGGFLVVAVFQQQLRIPMIVTDDSGIVTAQSGHRDRCRVVRDIACQANCTIA